MVCACVVLAQNAPPPPAGPRPVGPGTPGAGYTWRSGQTMMLGSSPSTALNPPGTQFVSRAAITLSLTQEQTEKLTAILTKSESTLTPLRQKLANASTAVRNAVVAATYDAENVKKLLADAMAAETTLVNAQLQTWVELRAVLSADQLARLQAAIGQRPGPGGFGDRTNRGTRGTRTDRPGGGNPPPAGPPPAPAPAPAN